MMQFLNRHSGGGGGGGGQPRSVSLTMWICLNPLAGPTLSLLKTSIIVSLADISLRCLWLWYLSSVKQVPGYWDKALTIDAPSQSLNSCRSFIRDVTLTRSMINEQWNLSCPFRQLFDLLLYRLAWTACCTAENRFVISHSHPGNARERCSYSPAQPDIRMVPCVDLLTFSCGIWFLENAFALVPTKLMQMSWRFLYDL